VEKAVLSKDFQNTKRKLGVTTHFSEIIDLKLGKKLSYILYILKLFLELWLLNYLLKMRGYPHFCFWIPIIFAKICVFPVVIAFAETPS